MLPRTAPTSSEQAMYPLASPADALVDLLRQQQRQPLVDTLHLGVVAGPSPAPRQVEGDLEQAVRGRSPYRHLWDMRTAVRWSTGIPADLAPRSDRGARISGTDALTPAPSGLTRCGRTPGGRAPASGSGHERRWPPRSPDPVRARTERVADHPFVALIAASAKARRL